MKRTWRHVLLVFALLFAQQAAQVHAFAHVRDAFQQDPDKSSPSSPHPAAQCLAFHAVDSVLPCGKIVLDPPRIEPLAPAAVPLPLSRPARIEFDSRAPPVLS